MKPTRRLAALLVFSVVSASCDLDWNDEHIDDAGAGDGDGDDGGAEQPDAGPDGGPDAGDRCLRDQDRDGFGVAGVWAACSGGAPIEPGDCDDLDPLAYPGAPQVLCDEVDNDCDGVREESSTETCNAIDDDCDGLVDPNLTDKLDDKGHQVFVQAGNAGTNPPTQAQVALLAREGGAWLLSRGYKSGPDAALAISAQKLDAQGLLDASATPVSLIPGASRFAADSDGKWLAVLARTRPTPTQEQDGASSLRLFLYKAENLTLVGEQTLVENTDDDSVAGDSDDRDDCHDVEPLDVAVFESAPGEVSIAAGSLRRVGKLPSGASSCSFDIRVDLYFQTFSTTNGWGPRADELQPHGAEGLVLERVPCRAEWVVAHGYSWSSPGWTLHVFRTDGTEVRPAFPGLANEAQNVTALAAQPGGCEAGDPTMALAYVGSAGSYVQRWKVDAETGATTAMGEPLAVSAGGRPTRLAHAGGRWFAAGHDVQVIAGGNTPPRFWELTFDSSASQVRELPLFAAVHPGEYNPNIMRVGLLALPEVTVAAFGMSTALSNLDDHRDPAATAPAVAVTYRIGCN